MKFLQILSVTKFTVWPCVSASCQTSWNTPPDLSGAAGPPQHPGWCRDSSWHWDWCSASLSPPGWAASGQWRPGGLCWSWWSCWPGWPCLGGGTRLILTVRATRNIIIHLEGRDFWSSQTCQMLAGSWASWVAVWSLREDSWRETGSSRPWRGWGTGWDWSPD